VTGVTGDNDAREKWCPACHRRCKWYETTCPSCGAALVDEGSRGAPDPAAKLVSVFHIRDGAVVPLATIALETAGIEYELRARNILIPGIARGGGEHTGFDYDVPGDIFVRGEDATRARDLLADLDHPTPPDPALAEPTPAEWADSAAAPVPDPDHDAE
jgi:hypothetical protein